MIFTVDEADSGDYRRITGNKLPETIEFGTLADLLIWIESTKNPIVVYPPDDEIHKPHITIYNGNLE